MSALHRLKAYFGMVPAEELDAAGLDAAQFDDYRPPYRSGYPDQGASQDRDPRGSGFDRATASAPTAYTSREGDYAAERLGVRYSHRTTGDDYGDGFATRAGRHAPSKTYPARPPAWATERRVAESRDSSRTDSWAAEAPIRGSLAIDTAALNTRSTAHQPAMPPRVTPVSRTGPLGEDSTLVEDSTPVSARGATRIVTLHPFSYNEARPIGERYREGNPVIMNLTAMEDRDAKRLVDFAAGLAFALRGSIDKITNKVFLLSPPNVEVSAEDRRRIAEGHSFN
jgi:cell division inhibitor SepF